MKKMLALLAAVAGLGAGTASAADLSALYDPATLRHWQPRYERSTLEILNEVIVPVLTTEARRRLGGTRVEFPLHAEGRWRGRPLAFYVPPDGARVVLPIFSLKFLDDLCTAYAWLQINGYTLETISEYTAMLRYADVPEGRYPPPLTALHVPADAREDPRVDELARGHFVTARTWLLLHELGHVHHRHVSRSFAQSRRNEEQADRFAVDVMRRTPLPPLGILVYFLADAHWAGYPSSAEDTHPLTGARVRSLAAALDDRGLADQLRAVAGLLDDPDIRTGFAATGRTGDFAALRPRRPGELPRPARTTARTTGAPIAFQGRYLGESRQFSDAGSYPSEVLLHRRGDRVNGEYSFGLGVGSLVGSVAGDMLHFEWTWAGNHGRGVFRASGDGDAFSGTWGYRQSADNAGTWKGRRAE